ncbi:hypothetical protein ABN09_00320 [Morganella morganii]|nr:hypothetical protein ABN09_00320 [Morganella morganii]
MEHQCMLKHTSILTQNHRFYGAAYRLCGDWHGATNQITESVQGNAHAINKSGTLRCRVTVSCLKIPLTAHSQQYLDDFESD